ncbi:MAG: xanthine dehydrogenase family protein molybdopterin-binding subunit [Salibaculum sp.]|uniref:xanthine dehydrogenase family protein molybdopterin-binding subunit n=1 Tax=Salibaculum sp. TaxID=2855480 RepID=UPI0028707A76|nr:xanthine dehydrogenase family protein molybdopterin-binding subunit [Salibaculum sp.]MDR9427773.1 xanthine dehydrogenase family protein molybdopterin-binding subunit [Salibaculum sp.]
MEKFGKSQPVRRVEDQRFLTGHGRYVDDIVPQGALRAVFLRAPVGHARITELDVAEARDAPGVHLVLTLADLEAEGLQVTMKSTAVRMADGSRGARPERPLLAGDRVRYVGEAIAMVVAETLQQARDAAELITLDFEDEPAHVELAPGGPQLHESVPDNIAFDWDLGDAAAVDSAIAGAAHVLTYEIADNRVIVNSMEPRGTYAEPEGNGRLHIAVNGQGVWGPKASAARHLGLPPEDIRVTNPDTGGGFGMKGMDHPETFVVAQAARMLNRPVRWMSERTEAMLSDNAGRDLTTTATLAFDADHRLVGYRLDTLANLGAYNSQFAQPIQTDLFSKVAPGVYDFQAIHLRCRGIYTNTAPVDAYRGAGRPEAIYVLERAMDYAARDLGVDPWQLHRRNFIPADKFPYTSATGQPYDVGDFHRVLDRLEQNADRAGFAARRAASEACGRLRGMGLCYYIESILGDPEETARVDFNADGTASIFVGTQSNGQGHETVFAQFLADQTGIPSDRISVVQGDSDLIAQGGGTGGSRSVTVQNTATLGAVAAITEAFAGYLAEKEGVAAEVISFDDERFRIPGSNLTPTMLEVAEMARAEGRGDLLSQSRTTKLENRSFPNGAHVAEVEIDPETGKVTLDRYTVVDDFGNLINPMLVEGQVHGGVVQGVGQALTEQAHYDAEGQLTTATFMDYAMPRADDVPMFRFDTESTPSLYNPMGMKGCGEAGTVGSMAATSNAVLDALSSRGVARADMPFTPHRVWQLLHEAENGAEHGVS